MYVSSRRSLRRNSSTVRSTSSSGGRGRYMKAWVMTPIFASRSGTKPPWKKHWTWRCWGRAPLASEGAGFSVNMAASIASANSPHGDHDGDEVGGVEDAADEQAARGQARPAGHGQEDGRGRGEGDAGRQEDEIRAGPDHPLLGREEERHDGGQTGLEDHRPGDVAHRQGVLALAH